MFATYQDLPHFRTPLKHIVHQDNSSPCNRADSTTTAYNRVKKRAGPAILVLRPKQRPREGQAVMKLAPCLLLGMFLGTRVWHCTVRSDSTQRLSLLLPKGDISSRKGSNLQSPLAGGFHTSAGITNDTGFSVGCSLATTDSKMPILIYKLYIQQHFTLGTW